MRPFPAASPSDAADWRGAPARAEAASTHVPAPMRSTILEWAERLVVAVILVMMSNALIGPLLDPNQSGGANNPILRLMWLPVYGVTVGLLLLRIPKVVRFWLPALLLGLIVAFCCMSVLWSINPDITQRRGTAIVFTTLFGVYLAARFDGRELSELMAGTFLFLAIGSYIVCIAVPRIGVHHDVNAGDWRGLWYEKNAMGAMMVYGALAAIAAALTNPSRRILWTITFFLCAGLVFMTHSKTSLVVLLLAAGGAGALALVGRHAVFGVGLVWVSVSVAIIAGGLLLMAPKEFFALLGKDATLTGRTDIWAAVLHYSSERPLLGYGYAAFWSKPSRPARWIELQTGWDVPTAHNGWLDVLVQTGWIGAAMVGGVFLAAVICATFRARRLNDGYWATLFLAVFLFESISESFFLLHNSVMWVFAVVALSRLLGPGPEYQPRAPAGSG